MRITFKRHPYETGLRTPGAAKAAAKEYILSQHATPYGDAIK